MSLETVSLETRMASALHYVDTADGVGVSLHVAWTVSTTGGTMIS